MPDVLNLLFAREPGRFVASVRRVVAVWMRPRRAEPRVRGLLLLFIGITLAGGVLPQIWGQAVTSQAPPVILGATASVAGEKQSPLPRCGRTPKESGTAEETGCGPAREAEQEQGQASGVRQYPDAVVVTAAGKDRAVTLESDTQTERNKVFVLDGKVVITYGERVLRADHVEYDANSGDLTANGHLLATGGPNHERIEATHGTLNIHDETGRFYDVHGAVYPAGVAAGGATPKVGSKIYSNGNPMLFTGRVVVRTGPTTYDLYDGSVTSCQLPNPDWLLTAAHFSIADEQAKGTNSTFHLLGFPILYLPYVTHPTDPDERESGFLIPTFGESSVRGLIVGEQYYLVLNRSMDLTVGAAYWSAIGFEQDANFRYKGNGLDFAKFRYYGVLDRRVNNQGGEDAVADARHDFSAETRTAGDVDYLSSYIFREAFTDNFNQAVTSDIVSSVYGVHEHDGTEASVLADRYQGLKQIAVGTLPEEQVHILHVPTFQFDTTEHGLAEMPFQVSFEGAVSGLKRSQPNFETGGVVERVDLHPEASAPFSLGAWRFRPSVALRETAYSRSFNPQVLNPQASAGNPSENLAALARSDVEFAFGIRAPVLERDFATPGWLSGMLGPEVRHTLEPEVTYRLTNGVENFKNILRFDATDVVSNTNEVEYGLTQRIFRRHAARSGCTAAGAQAMLPDAPDTRTPGSPQEAEGGLNPDPTISAVGYEESAAAGGCGSDDELISWRLTQKYFFDPTFGGAVMDGRRNIFQTTLDLSGVAFLTEPRNISPLVSRLRARLSSHTDIEWDFDYDTGASKLTSSNVYLDVHRTSGLFGALSYARLDAPGRFFTEAATPTTTTGVTTQISDFNQLRLLLGYGSPVKPGLSLAANTGLDLKSLYGATGTETLATGAVTTTTVYPALLQYATVQANYNFNCCGVQVEYRKFELGSVRNEGTYRFNLTLANIGSAGNLKRAERLF